MILLNHKIRVASFYVKFNWVKGDSTRAASLGQTNLILEGLSFPMYCKIQGTCITGHSTIAKKNIRKAYLKILIKGTTKKVLPNACWWTQSSWGLKSPERKSS